MRPIALSIVSVAFLAQAQDSVPLKQTFGNGTEGWMVMGQNGSVKTVKAGGAMLDYSYTLDANSASTAILPVAPGKLAGMCQIRFRLKSDHDTAIGVVLSEKKPGGGSYTAVFWAPKDSWRQIALTPSDFAPNDGPTDPVDADGKLDPDQIEGVGIVDLAGFFNHLPADAPMVVDHRSGSFSILLDGFEVLATPAPARPASKTGAVTIDGFDRGFSEWITLGGAQIELSSAGDNPLNAPALAATMKGVDGKLVLLLKRVPTAAATLTGMKRLVFDIASEHEVTLIVSAETLKAGASGGQGPRYNFMIYPQAGRKVFRVNVSLADFEHDANSPDDASGVLEASHLKSLSIGDITSMAGGTAADNKIWIGRIEMIK